MNKIGVGMISFLVGMVIVIIIDTTIIIFSYETHKKIIEHDCGEYNQTTGDWQWKEAK